MLLGTNAVSTSFSQFHYGLRNVAANLVYILYWFEQFGKQRYFAKQQLLFETDEPRFSCHS